MREALATSSKAMKRGKRPRVRKTPPCRAGQTRVRYCRLMAETLDHNRNVVTLTHLRTQSPVVVYDRGVKHSVFAWVYCPYCGEPIIPKKARP